MKWKKTFFGILIFLIIIQIFRIDKSNPPVITVLDYMSVTGAPDDIENLIRRSCYDCHSNESVYPWYAGIAPVSWLIKSHINNGRNHVNFSEWGKYPGDVANRLNDECYEEIVNKKMPLKSYTLFHSNAKLTPEEIDILEDWFTSQRKERSGPNPYELSV